MTAPFFLLLAVVISVVGCTVVYLRQRTPKSVDSGIKSFKREMEALATRPGPDIDGAPEAGPVGSDAPMLRRLWKR